MTGHTQLSDGWLAEELREASSDLALSMSPGMVAGSGLDGMLSEGDARRLRQKMVKRYADWTGRDLATDLGSDRNI